jgi:transposase-like protein
LRRRQLVALKAKGMHGLVRLSCAGRGEAIPRPRKLASPFRYFHSSPEVIRVVVKHYVRVPLSLRNVENLPFERGIDVCHETVRFWWMDSNPIPRPCASLARGRREMGRHTNSRVENSHLPLRRRKRALLRSRRLKSLRKFAAVHTSHHNHFNQERHLVDRQTCKDRRSAALDEWQSLAA